eukprot:9494644-Pyramimonas_sp.AAC.1
MGKPRVLPLGALLGGFLEAPWGALAASCAVLVPSWGLIIALGLSGWRLGGLGRLPAPSRGPWRAPGGRHGSPGTLQE